MSIFLNLDKTQLLKVFTLLSPSARFNLLILFGAGLLFWSGLASLLPTLPLYIQSAGANSQQVGMVMGCFAIGLLASRAWLAKLTDRAGRKCVLLIGMGAIALAPLGYCVTASLPLLMLLRAFHGISIAAFALAYSALVVDLSPPQNRGELIGYMSLVNPLGLAIGPALGGFLQEWFNFQVVFLMSAGMGMLGLMCTAKVRECPTPKNPNAAIASNQFWALLMDARIRVPAVIMLLVGLSFGTLSTFVPLYIKSVGAELNVGLFYTAVAIASFGVRLVAGPGSDRYGRGPFITISLILYTLAMLLLWQATSAELFLLAAVIQGAGSGTIIPMVAALMADRSFPHERGRTFGVCMVGFDLGLALAGPLLGTVADQVGYANLFGFCGGLTGLGILIFLTCSSKDVAHSLRFALGRGRDVYAVD
ncbi:MAG: MFS transporter [Synechococcales cyanobacterium T60_A2020_003]|nr:MFS transporter [Synechococcales cyanobacterium T60_A2020_003]